MLLCLVVCVVLFRMACFVFVCFILFVVSCSEFLQQPILIVPTTVRHMEHISSADAVNAAAADAVNGSHCFEYERWQEVTRDTNQLRPKSPRMHCPYHGDHRPELGRFQARVWEIPCVWIGLSICSNMVLLFLNMV